MSSLIPFVPTAVVLAASFLLSLRPIFAVLSGVVTALFLAAVKTGTPLVEIFGISFLGALDINPHGNLLDEVYHSPAVRMLFSIGVLFSVIAMASKLGWIQAFIDKIAHKKKTSPEKIGAITSLIFVLDEYIGVTAALSSARSVAGDDEDGMVRAAALTAMTSGPLVAVIPFSTWGAFIAVQANKALSAIASGTGKTLAELKTSAGIPISDALLLFRSNVFAFSAIASVIVAVVYVLFLAKRVKVSGSALKLSQETVEVEEFSDGYSWLGMPILIATIMGVALFSLLTKHTLVDSLLFGNIAGFALTFVPVISRFGTLALFSAVLQGYKEVASPTAVIVSAWTMAEILQKYLGISEAVSGTIGDGVSPWLIPIFFYVLMVIAGISMVSCWGAMSVIFPIAIPIAYHHGASVLFMTVGAIVAGGQLSNMLSPVSDMMVLSAAAAKVRQWLVVKTTRRISFWIGVASLLAMAIGSFAMLKLSVPWWIVAPAGIALSALPALAMLKYGIISV